MRDISFIQGSSSLSKIIVEETQQFYDLGLKIGILCGSSEILESVDQVLWTQKQISFIPHATQNDGSPELQPVYVSVNFNFPNAPHVLLCVECAPIESVFQKEVIIFSPTSNFLESIRQYYRSLIDSAHKVTFTKE
jgi:DNA polymerase-3 subunit chi